jgi:hypothetical protein
VTGYGDGVSPKGKGIRGKAMEFVGAVLVLFLFSIPILAIFLLLLLVVFKFLQLSCYALAWLCLGVGKLCEVVFETKRSAITTPVSTSGRGGVYITQ